MKKFTVLLLLLFSCSLQALETIIQSPADDKSYRPLVLENGLRVLLISDPGTDKSAASLDINIGNGSDPEEWLGLAHFLEHMLFLGNRKYPEAGEYQRFIQNHGGSNNAFTSFDHTNYFFSISSDYLVPALDRFSRFFIDPTFDEQFVDRERAIVHSEYQARRKDEGRRLWAAGRELVNPEHPYARFAIGSIKTLADKENETARQALIEFYQKYYSAKIMTLVVLGRESLDQLEAIVRDKFSAVADTGAQAQSFNLELYDREMLPVQLKLVPELEGNRVSFTFLIPSIEGEYLAKPAEYISNLLGHEGEGSLLALLKSLGWGENLVAGVRYMDEFQGSYTVSIGLTEPGLEHLEEIGRLLFSQILLIRNEGIEAWRFKQDQKLAQIAFRFRQEHDAGSYVMSLASRMHDYKMVDVLRGPYIKEYFRPDRIRELLDELRPHNLIMTVISKKLKTSRVTPWYEVDFELNQIPGSWMTAWQSVTPDRRLGLPTPNLFIPERLDLLVGLATSETPVQITSQTGFNTWYRADESFGTPRAGFYFSIQSPIAGNSARHAVLTDLYIKLVNDQLTKVSYPAQLAGVKYSLYRHGRGYSVKLSGYEDKQHELLTPILAALRQTDFDDGQLELVKAELRRDLENIGKTPPADQLIGELYRLLMNPAWTEQEQLAEIDSVTPGELRIFIADFYDNINITLLAHGDSKMSSTQKMEARIRETFVSSKLQSEIPRPRLRELSDGVTYLRTLDIEHPDSALIMYLQGQQGSVSERARLYLLSQLIESPYYFYLRTSNQVGYVVYATPMNILEVPGLVLAVQSPSHQPAQIYALMDDFLQGFDAQLDAISEAEFDQVKQGLISLVQLQDKRLSDRTNRYWREIDLKRFQFDSRQQLADEILKLSKRDIGQYFAQMTSTSKRRMLLIKSPGTRDVDERKSLKLANSKIIEQTVKFRDSAKRFFPAYQ
jgi:secreted Zn-dependent insulinase-like peptidase